jgi:nitrite reductase/ring-hydroxylating ferredoxin subunit
MGWREHRYAPPPGALLCRVDSVEDGACKEIRFGEGEFALSLLMYRDGVDMYAYVNSCPHFSLPLNARPGRFLLLTGRRVMCAWHCAEFQLTDGRCLSGPAAGLALQRVALTVRDGSAYLSE